jgi:hypothetical protein
MTSCCPNVDDAALLMGGVKSERVKQTATVARGALVQIRGILLQQHNDDIVYQGDGSTVWINLPAIVQQRCLEQMRVGVTGAYQCVIDIEAVTLSEPRHALKK